MRAKRVRKTVLVVDDDADMRRLLQRHLERSGRYQVSLASGGREAIARARSESPDLILCDIDMPDLDGGSVACALSEEPETAEIPLLFLSGLVDDRPTDDGEIGGWPMVSKRSHSRRVIARIDDLLGRA